MSPEEAIERPRLPIDPIMPDIVQALREHGVVVIEAPPGAGKTTRVPWAMLEAGLAGRGEILVLEPRRLAARMAAVRVSVELGERVGETVGYQVRYEDVTGPGTRLKFMTEGVLVRRLASDPLLAGVGAIVFDEFHERHLHGDLALALSRRLRELQRPDLKLAVMSATLDGGPIADWLAAPIVRSEGRLHPVEIEYLPSTDPRDRIENRVSRAVRRLHAKGAGGNILVFLPGMAEIRRSIAACKAFAAQEGLELLPLHGDLPPEEQDRAVLPGGRPRVIFATNVAETSVTIDGVTAVVDSGLARVASHSPWSGLPRLELGKISRASAAQRAGRAGRTGPGKVVRLYGEFDHDMRPAFDLPEIVREDLAETALLTASMDAADLSWLEPPPAAALAAARALLGRLGALDGSGGVTGLGRDMLRFPLHPRLARLVMEASARGAGREGALVATLISERDIRDRERDDRMPGLSPTGSSDPLELSHLYHEAERVRFAPDRLRGLGLDAFALSRVRRAWNQVAAILPSGRPGPPTAEADQEEALMNAVLAAFSDRLGRRRDPGGEEVVLAGGGSARMAPESVVRSAPLLVAIEVEERRNEGGRNTVAGKAAATIRLASAVTPEMLLDLFPDRLRWEESASWNESASRVEGWEKLSFDGLVLEASRKASVAPALSDKLLADAARAKGARAFAPEGSIDRLLARMAFVAESVPESGVKPLTEGDVDQALSALCIGRRSFAELEEANLVESLLSGLPREQRGVLDRMAPERVSLGGGRSVMVRYDGDGRPPWIESRLQDFFGAKAGPSIGNGRFPLVLHLLAPNMRAVQVTTDLSGFWERHYPTIRKELMRRYPRHDWPENPLAASPPPVRKR
jgi:ATP-dependent helicase HrpB